MNQKFPIITRPSTSCTGKLQSIEQSNAIHARPRTIRETRREQISRLFWTLTIALGVGYLAHSIAMGLPHVLTMHGVI